MQFKTLIAFFAMVMAVVAAPATEDHKSNDHHEVDQSDYHDKEKVFEDDHSVDNDVDVKAEDHSSKDKDDHSNSCGDNQTAMCCDSLNKKEVNGLELLLGQGCLANVLGCTNQAACCKQEGGGLSLIQVCQLA